MKTTLFLISILLQSIVLIGQSYQSIFSADTTRWNVYECAPDAGGTIVYYSYSDTLINEKTYHIIYRERIYSADQKLRLRHRLCGFVNEDTINGKYWFLKIHDNEQKEVLFMDLNLSKGDSMAIIRDFRYMWTDSVVVDSVYYENDRKIITINQTHVDCYDAYDLKFIEGIGSTNGFYMGESYEEPESYTLICKIENGIKTYTHNNDWFRNCYHDEGAAVNDSDFDNKISLFPNPSQRKISIEVNEFGSDLSYTIINSQGQLISKGDLSAGSNELDFDKNGIFFITISDEKFQTIKKVIIYGY